jgi:uncharacterized Tic20 family protein
MTREPKIKEPGAVPAEPAKPAAITNDQKNLAFICHLSGLFWFIVPGLNIIIPLLVMLIKGDDAFISHHSRQALIFQVIMSVVMMVLLAVGVVLLLILVGFLILAVLAVVGVVDVIFILIATFAAARGEWYHYPLMARV